MDEPRICVVGAGSLSSKRIYPYLGAAGGVLAGACDLEIARAERMARLYGGVAYDQMDRMLDAESPDGVIVCIGPAAHAELSARVLRRGLAVYTEKPPAPSADAALQLARLSAETGLLCTTAFKKRYNVAYSRAKEWIDRFDPGDRYSLSIDYASAQYANRDERTSFLGDFCIHAIDLVGWLFGDVAEVFCFAKGPDAYAVSLRFTCGAVGSMNLTDGRSFTVPTEEVEITIRGGNFMTVHNSSAWRITEQGRPSEWREPPTFVSGGDSGLDTGHLAELVDFVEALGEGRSTSRSAIYEGYKSLLLYEAIRASAESGRPVSLAPEPL